VAYVSALPSYAGQLASCQAGPGGKLKVAKESHNALVKLATPRSVRQATMFVDPLCPTCKAFHERLVAEDVLDKLDAELVMFPLDSECNWMLDTAIHPGACVLARAVLCSKQPRAMLDWAFANQEDLKYLAIGGKDKLKSRLAQQWGQELVACTDQKDTQVRLNRHLQFAVANQVQVSTPQMFLGDARLCDEDTDLGLRYALSQLAPEVLR
jgi:protein-disulfide isomerase